MNDLGDAIFSDVVSVSAITSLLGTSPTRLAPMFAPQEWATSLYGVYTIESHEFDDALAQATGMTKATITFEFFKRRAATESAPGYRDTRNIVRVFRDTYHTFTGTLGTGSTTVTVGQTLVQNMGESPIGPADGDEFGTYRGFITFDMTYDIEIPS